MGKTKAPIFAIGDIHGCAPELHRLLAELPLTPDSTIVFLGDMIDRGNYSREVITTILDLKQKYNVIALCGNHEDMLLEFLGRSGSPEGASFIMNGGSSTLASYADESGNYTIPGDHIQFFRSLRLIYETDDFIFVHAGLPEIPLEEIRADVFRPILLWTRNPFLQSTYDWGKVVVHGHTPTEEPTVSKNRINIDTGCYYDGRLTAIEVNSRQFYSVEKSYKNEPRIFLRDKSSSRIATRFPGEIEVRVLLAGKEVTMVTQNYSEFGLLLVQPRANAKPLLKLGEAINGVIGNHEHRKIFFNGSVVRCETRESEFLYGIKIDRVTPADEAEI